MNNMMRQEESYSSEEIPQLRKELLQSLLPLAAENYKDSTRIVQEIEDKANKAATLASAILAVGMVFVKPEMRLVQLGGAYGVRLLSASIALLLVCIGFSISVTWRKRSPIFLPVAHAEKHVSDMLTIPAKELTHETLENFWRDQVREWNAILSQYKNVYSHKAQFLLFSQIAMVIALCMIAAFLLLILFRANGVLP
jgi:hypothetical protein